VTVGTRIRYMGNKQQLAAGILLTTLVALRLRRAPASSPIQRAQGSTTPSTADA
jgi:hypothetical protein